MRNAALAFAVVLFAVPAVADGEGETKPALVVVYDGYGTPSGFRVGGRVLEDRDDGKGDSRTSSAARNLVNNLSSLESDELPNASLSVVVGGRTFTATTDADGMFEVVVKNLPAAEQLALGAQPVVVSVTAPDSHAGEGKGVVYVVNDEGAVGVISDIDDTVVQTFVTDKAKMLAEVMLKNSKQLQPVVGAAANYQAAQAAGAQAFFYVSGSPQNFYLRLKDYLSIQGFPGGPIFLKNLGDDKLLAHDEYKLGKLERILAALPKMSFVLVGDSGERDPEIYQTLRGRHPERIKGIVIRKVPGSKHTEPERFGGCVVVDDVYASDAVVRGVFAAGAVPAGETDAPTTSTTAPTTSTTPTPSTTPAPRTAPEPR